MKDIVYLSYTRNDSEFASLLANTMLQKHFDVWFDIKNINIGDNINEIIKYGLTKCTAMILLLSESSYSSQYVRNEIEYVLINNKLQKKILPVFISKEKKEIDFNKLPWILRQIQFLVLDGCDDKNVNIEKIIKAYTMLINREE